MVRGEIGMIVEELIFKPIFDKVFGPKVAK